MVSSVLLDMWSQWCEWREIKHPEGKQSPRERGLHFPLSLLSTVIPTTGRAVYAAQGLDADCTYVIFRGAKLSRLGKQGKVRPETFLKVPHSSCWTCPALARAVTAGETVSWTLKRHTGRSSNRNGWPRRGFVEFHPLWTRVIMKLHQFAVAESLTQMTRNANQTWGPKLTILIFIHEGAPGNGPDVQVLDSGENPAVTLLPPQRCCSKGTECLALHCSSWFVQEQDCSILQS